MSDPDVLIVGAGPAGSVAAIVLARAGVRVRLVDRARFPRQKLCGDTLNPGLVAALGRLRLDGVLAGSLPLVGMRITGPGGACVEGHYEARRLGASLSRYELDCRLVHAAASAGVDFDPHVTVAGPRMAHVADASGGAVAGVLARTGGSQRVSELQARVTIAADGRRSVLASALGLARTPRSPRRWAVGAYYENVHGLGPVGEMHIRQGHYIGVAPLPGGVANAILVLPLAAARAARVTPTEQLSRALSADPELASRFGDARRVTPVTVLGPLGVDVSRPSFPGLLLAGDAAGFIDPMTGDGMRIAVRGAELAAEAALRALAGGWAEASSWLAQARTRAFSRKLRFNRALRAMTASPLALRLAAWSLPAAAPILRWAVNYAGDAFEN